MVNERSIFIIDGLNQARGMLPPAQIPVRNRDNTSNILSPFEWFRNILENGPEQNSFVIALCDNFKLLANARDILPLFMLRVGFNMSDDDIGSFLTGTPGSIRIKSNEQTNIAYFYDQSNPGVISFKPYTLNGLEGKS